MWIVFALLSAFFLGLYDVSKKQALINNTVLPVLWLNTIFSSLILIPLIIFSSSGHIPQTSSFFVHQYEGYQYLYILVKSFLVLSSWVFGYWGLKHLPVTIVSPINAMRPVLVLMGALLIFGERLSFLQWIGCILAIISFYMLSKTGSLENINFKKNKWIYLIIISNFLGAFSALYDKFLFAPSENGGIGLNAITVLVWFSIFQCFIMSLFLGFIYILNRKIFEGFKWRYSIFFISLFISMADFAYYYSLSFEEAMISIVSMSRRGSVIVSFFIGALLFKEKNIKTKSLDILLVIASILLLLLGTTSK